MKSKGFPNGKNDLRRGIDFIGVSCAFICHDGKGRILMHKRSSNCRDEQGHWDNGAGALEYGESLEKAVRREVKEEYGADIKRLQFAGYLDVHRTLDDGTPTHWVCIMHAAEVDPKQAKNNEPYKIDEIGWFEIDKLPSPLHSQSMNGIRALQALNIL
ncbi:MAG TPA: NUDIX domain-containing protein [Candidatus Saccharimonadales bacterium]|nr:NUDIX domain-containing protein [Candidatus Saccharimonadales bacterium]